MNTTKESPHGTNRKTAAVVGVLFIIGTVSGILGAIIGKPILDAPDYLIKISANEGQMHHLALLNLSWALPVPVLALRCIQF